LTIEEHPSWRITSKAPALRKVTHLSSHFPQPRQFNLIKQAVFEWHIRCSDSHASVHSRSRRGRRPETMKTRHVVTNLFVT
jgi:hypothetical protein